MRFLTRYLPLIFVIVSCNSMFPDKKQPPVSTATLDTVKNQATQVIEPAILETAFAAGTSQLLNNHEFQLYGINIGKIKLPSGRLVAVDPMHIDEYGKPFTQLFPQGEFPVQLAITKIGDQEKIAFSRILFSDARVAEWKMALFPKQDSFPVGREKIRGFSVDGSTAMFIDSVAIRTYDKKLSENMEAPLFKEMDKNYRQRWRYAMYAFGENNLAVFSTGMGDGYFASYVGLDANGQVCRLTTDFNFFEWRKREE